MWSRIFRLSKAKITIPPKSSTDIHWNISKLFHLQVIKRKKAEPLKIRLLYFVMNYLIFQLSATAEIFTTYCACLKLREI
jgi:hypothetical protein